MRIAHVSDFYLPRMGGIEMHISDLASRQVQLGHEVTVVTSSPGRAGDGDGAGVRVVRVTEQLRRPRPLHPRAPSAGVGALLAGRYDLVHVHVGVGSPLGFWAALRCAQEGLPTVVTVHSLWAWAHPAFRTLNALGGFSRQPIRWTAVSHAAAEPVRRVVRGAAAVTVLPNGIDPRWWQVPALPRPPDELLVVAVMRLAVRKRPLALLRMLLAVRQQVPAEIALRVLIVGDGPQRDTVERFLRRHSMGDWVQLTGQQSREQIRELYRRADAFVAPADLESFGIAALEARCAGVPVVAKAASGIAEFVTNGLDGLLVPDDAGMVDALVQLCRRPELRTALAERARSQPSPVSWTSTLALTEAAYAEAQQLVVPRPALVPSPP